MHNNILIITWHHYFAIGIKIKDRVIKEKHICIRILLFEGMRRIYMYDLWFSFDVITNFMWLDECDCLMDIQTIFVNIRSQSLRSE